MTRGEMARAAELLKQQAVSASGRVQIPVEMALKIAGALEDQLKKGA